MIALLLVLSLLSPRDDFRHEVNEVRDCPLRSTGHVLVQSARQHSREMARAGHIFHTDPLEPGKWDYAGEVVGVSDHWRYIFEALMDSPPHRRILHDCTYQKIAVGIARIDDTVWLTARLYG